MIKKIFGFYPFLDQGETNPIRFEPVPMDTDLNFQDLLASLKHPGCFSQNYGLLIIIEYSL